MYKISRFAIYLTLASALLLELTVLNYIRIFGSTPDLLLICVVFFALFQGPGVGLEVGIAAGLFQDFFALDFFGINTFVFAVTGLFAGVIQAKFFKESRMTQSILVIFFTVFSMALHYMLVSVFSKYSSLNFSDYLITSIMPVAVYTALVSIPIFGKFIEMYNLKEPEDFL